MKIPIEPLLILDILYNHNFEGFIVGGAVRDLIMDPDHPVNISDFDFATNALPEELLQIFPGSFYENNFGTVSIEKEKLWQLAKLDDHKKSQLQENYLKKNQSHQKRSKIIDLNQATKIHSSLSVADAKKDLQSRKSIKPHLLEITTYRTQEVYLNNCRKPHSLSWGKSLSEDLTRRDFTINALALKLDAQSITRAINTLKSSNQLFFDFSNNDYSIIDNHGGIIDLQDKTIKTVGDAKERFEEDPLRMLRAIRFVVQLDMKLDDGILTAIKEKSFLLGNISFERIRDEFLLMLASQNPKKAVLLLDQTKLLAYILPELILTKNVQQAGHHISDVWTHSLDSLQNCPSLDPIVRLATLLHDIAKPQTLRVINNQPTFYNHEIIGARMARDIAKRLKLSNKQVQRIFLLVRHHMFHYQTHNTSASIRRFMRNVGLSNIDDILDLREADRLGSGAKKTSWRLEEMKQKMIEQLHQPFSISDLDISGDDVMQILQISPGKQVGDVLQKVFDQVNNQQLENNRAQITAFIKENFMSNSY